jgi:hypothetical protein
MTMTKRRRVNVERLAGAASLPDVLDRVLDRGIVIESWARVTEGFVSVPAPSADERLCEPQSEREKAAYARGLADGLAAGAGAKG